MGENSDDNDPFEEDIVFDQSGLLTSRSSYSRQQMNTGVIPTFMLFIRTVFLCVAFTGLGLCASVSQGPVIHLEVAVGIPIQKAFHSFTAHSIGMLIGGILGSVLFEIYNRQFLIFVSLLWMSVSVSVLPFTIPVSYWWTLVNLAALGAGLSFLFTGSNVLCLDLWGKQGGASLQSLHFSFALGAFIAPIIIHPFISGAFPSEYGGIQKGSSISPSSTQPPTFYNERIKRMAENNMANEMIIDKIGNISIPSSTSLENLTLPVVTKVTNDLEASSTISPSVLMNVSTTTEVIMNESENIKPKPKPAFTNGNSIPEKDKWKRPPPKDTLKFPDAMSEAGEKTAGVKTDKSETGTNLADVKTDKSETDEKTADVTTMNISVNLTDNSTNAKSDDIKNNKTEISSNLKSNSTEKSDEGKISSTEKSTAEINLDEKLTDVVASTLSPLIASPSNISKDSLLESPSSATSNVPSLLKEENSLMDIERTNVPSPVRIPTILEETTTQKTLIDSSVISGPTDIIDKQNGGEDINLTDDTIAFKSSLDKKVKYSNASPDKVDLSSETDSIQAKSSTIAPGLNVVESTTPIFKKPIVEEQDVSKNYEVTPNMGTTPENKKYLIEYNNNSYSSWDDKFKDPLYADDFPGPDQPEVQDLKEYPSKEDEASTISVTASFSSDGNAHKSSNHQSKPGTYSNASDTNSRFFESLVERFKNYGVTSIHFIYICIGIFLLVNAFISVIIMCHNPREPRSKQEDLSHSSLNKIFFGVFSVYMFASEAVEGAVRHLLASSQTENGIPIASKNLDGAAVFWGLVCVMRFICILVFGFSKVKPGKVLVSSTFFTVVGTIFLCIGTFDKQDFLWGGIVVIALGLAPVLPTSFLWMAEHMRISHRMCAIMIVISSFGNSLTHTTLTHVLANSHMYAYILIGISLGAMVFLTVAFCILYRAQKAKRLSVPIGYQLANQDEDETLELTRPTPKTFDNINRRLSDMGEAGQALLID